MNKLEQHMRALAEKESRQRDGQIEGINSMIAYWSERMNSKEIYTLPTKEYKLYERQLITIIGNFRELLYSRPTVMVEGVPSFEKDLKHTLHKAIDLFGNYLLRVQKLIERNETATPQGEKQQLLKDVGFFDLPLFTALPNQTQERLLNFLCSIKPSDLPKKIAYCMEIGLYEKMTQTIKAKKDVYHVLAKILNDGKNKDDIKKNILAYENPKSGYYHLYTAYKFREEIRQDLEA